MYCFWNYIFKQFCLNNTGFKVNIKFYNLQKLTNTISRWIRTKVKRCFGWFTWFTHCSSYVCLVWSNVTKLTRHCCVISICSFSTLNYKKIIINTGIQQCCNTKDWCARFTIPVSSRNQQVTSLCILIPWLPSAVFCLPGCCLFVFFCLFETFPVSILFLNLLFSLAPRWHFFT